MELTCIICPKGCTIKYELDKGLPIKIEGYSCPRGKKYASDELTNPTRTITSTIIIENAKSNRLPVITSKPIPKNRIFDVMDIIHSLKVKAPITIGTSIYHFDDLDVDLLATKTIEFNDL